MQRKIMLIFLIVVLAIFNYSIYTKEKLLKRNNEVIFLELATRPCWNPLPHHDRSLAQGDYIDLDYTLESHLSIPGILKNKALDYLVIQTDERKIGQFVRFYGGEKLAPKEKLLRFQNIFGKVYIFPHQFFVKEGHISDYKQARYAILKYSKEDDYLLVGLADEWQREIHVN